MDDVPPPDEATTNAEIVKLREGGMGWQEIADRYGLSRQSARHAYQKGKREERRAARRQQ